MNSGSVPKIFVLGNKILSNKLLQLQKECTRDRQKTHSHQNMLDDLNKQKQKQKKKTATIIIVLPTAPMINPIALRKAKIAYNFGHSECNRVNLVILVDYYDFLTNSTLYKSV